MNTTTQEKIKEVREQNQSVGCFGCGGRVDDGNHEYNEKEDVWYCPLLDEE